MYLSLKTQQINGIGLSSSFLSLLRQSYDGITFWIGRLGVWGILFISMLIVWPVSAFLSFLLQKINRLDIKLTNDNLSKYWELNMKLKNNLDDYEKVKNLNTKNVPFLLRGVLNSFKKSATLQIENYHKIDALFTDFQMDTCDSIFTQITTKEIMDIRPSPYKYLA